MKNSLIKNFLILILLLWSNFSLSDDLIFDTETINITNNGNLTIAKNGIATLEKENLEISGKIFEYDNGKKILTVLEAISFLKQDSIKIKSDKIFYNRNDLKLIATGNVELENLEDNSKIFTEEIIFDNNSKNIISEKKSKFIDNYNNSLHTNSFYYDMNTNIAKINSLELLDSQKNKYFLEKSFLNMKTKKLVGKDVFVNLNNLVSGNNFRIKSLGLEKENEKTIMNKAVFTPCKKNGKCPPWQLAAETITHDKEKKTMYYKNAWLKIYNQPVLYFPSFFHPDPTVKRQSGFLIPSFTSSKNLGNSINIPYFKVLSDSKDLTLKPKIFGNNKLLAQSEYRQIGKNSYHEMDFSILADNDTSNRSHFFSKTTKKFESNNKFFEESDVSIDIQQVSNDSYLQSYKLESPLIVNNNVLTSSINYNGFNEDLSFSTEVTVYENLTKNDNDRYEYILPSYNLSKQLLNDSNFNGNLNLNSSGSIKEYDTNVKEKLNINDLIYNSNTYYLNSGIENNFNLIFKNVNSESKNSTNYKNSFSSNINGLAEINSAYPLIKKTDNYKKILIPKVSLRLNPRETKNKKDDTRIVGYENIFDLNRLAVGDTLEGGESLTYGFSYYMNNKLDRELFSAKVANVLRIEEDKNIPISSSLGQKTSNVVSAFSLSPSENFKIDYQHSLDENLSDTNYQLLSSDISINNFLTSFEYLNESLNSANNSYLYNKTSYKFDNNNMISFETRENKKDKITEFYNLIYQYQNDCLIAAIEYNKEYYDFRDLKPEEKLFFKLTIIPFGQTSSPNLYK